MRVPVYFIENSLGNVKIGYATDLVARMSGLQSSNSGKLEFLRIIDGSKVTERWLLKRFAHLKIRGEWFRFHEDMLTIVPPDELPPRVIPFTPVKIKGMAETLRDIDADKLVTEDRLVAFLLLSSMSADDHRDFIAWARARTGVFPEKKEQAS